MRKVVPRPAEARACYARAADLDAADVRWPYLLALLAARTDPDEALGLHDRVLARESRFIPALVRAGDLLRLLDRVRRRKGKEVEEAAVDPQEQEEGDVEARVEDPMPLGRRLRRLGLGLGRGSFRRVVGGEGFLGHGHTCAPGGGPSSDAL